MKIDLSGLTDPTYNQPVTGYEVNGLYFRVLTKDRCCAWVEFNNLKDAQQGAARLEARIETYQKLIDSGKTDRDSTLANQYILIAKRHLDIYRKIYIPCATEWENKQAKAIPVPVAIVEVQPAEPIIDKRGQVSLF